MSFTWPPASNFSWPPFQAFPRNNPRDPAAPMIAEHFDAVPFFPFGKTDPDSYFDPSVPSIFSIYHYMPPKHDPLIFDLQGTGFRFTALNSSTAHFAYKDGTPVQTSWMTAGQGMLVQDLHPATLQVTADELVGNQSGNGLVDLARLDSNADGIIDARDFGFGNLKLWIDPNLDGITDPGELHSLASLGIASISLAFATAPPGSGSNGVQILSSFSFGRSNGTVGHGVDVNFATRQTYTYYVPETNFEFSPQASLLPQLLGYGRLAPLAVSTTHHAGLLAEEQALVLSSTQLSGKQFDAAFDLFAENWAGVSGLDVNSRGAGNNARHVAIVEQFYGATWNQTTGDGNDPNGPAVGEYEAIYLGIRDFWLSRFISQVSQSQVALGVSPGTAAGRDLHVFDQIVFDNRTDSLTGNFAAVVEAAIAAAPAGTAATAYWEKMLPLIRSLRLDFFQGDASALNAAFQPLAASHGVAPVYQQLAAALFASTHTLYASDSTGAVLGTNGPDLLIADAGGRTLVGGKGDDTYVWHASTAGKTLVSDNWFSSHDKLLLVDIRPGEVALGRIGFSDNVTLTLNATGASLEVAGQFSSTSYGRLESFVFGDGTAWTANEIKTRLLAQESAQNSGSVLGFEISNDVLVAGLGDKYLDGHGGTDLYVYSAAGGNDTIHDPERTSSLTMQGINFADVTLSRIGHSNDLLITNHITGKTVTIDNEFFYGGSGELASIDFADNVHLDMPAIRQMVLEAQAASGQASMYGFQGFAETLVAGAGDHYLNGLGSADTYVYSAAGGNDTINDPENRSSLVMQGINFADVTLTRIGHSNDLLITSKATGATITVDNEFYYGGGGNLAAIQFADNVSLDAARARRIVLDAQSASDDSSIYGFQGFSDRLEAGRGNRYLNSLGGTDTFVYAANSGNDIIYDPESRSSLEMSGIKSTEVSLARTGLSNDLVIKVTATNKTVTVQNGLAAYTYGALAAITFADNVSLAAGALRERLLAQELASGQTSIYGFEGYDGPLAMGTGDRYFNNLRASCRFVYSPASGNDTINDSDDHASLTLSGINPGDVQLFRAGNGEDLKILDLLTGRSILVIGEFTLGRTGTLRSIDFANGVSLDQQGAALAAQNLTVAQALARTGGLGPITNSAYKMSVSDTAAKVGAALDELRALGQVCAIVLSDSQPLHLRAAQLTSDAALLALTTNADGSALSYFVTDGPVISGAAVDYSHSAGAVYADLGHGYAYRAATGTSWYAGTASIVAADFLPAKSGITGSPYDDVLVGDGGGNLLLGGAGSDVLFGLGGDDTLIGGTANAGSYNQLWGGEGRDTASYAGTTSGIYASIEGHGGYVKDAGGAYVLTDAYNSIENLTGGSGADVLVGDGGNNVLEGAAGADQLYGRGGANTFVYRAYSDSNVVTGYDTIADFKTGIDKLDLTAFQTNAGHVIIKSGTASTKLWLEVTPGTFNPATDLAVSLIGVNAISAGDIVFGIPAAAGH